MPIISSFSNQFKPIGGNLVVINDLIVPPSNDFTYMLIPNNDLTYTLIPTNDLNYVEIPNNDILYGFIPDNDINYVTIPNNDVAYTLIPNPDLTYTLIPNNDIEYTVLKPPTVFYGEIKLGEDSVEGTCNCAEWECPRFYVTGDGPTFCDSNIFVRTDGETFFNGWGTISYGGYYKTVNMDGTNIATYRTDCGTCPTTPTPTPTSTPTPTPTPTDTPTPTPTPTPTDTPTPTPTSTPIPPTATPTPTPTPTSTPILYLNCYTVRQYLYGYSGGGASTLYILGTDYPNVGNIPVGATATINGTSVTITHNVFDDTAAYFQGGSGYRINVTPNVGNISAGTYVEFCWYSTTPPSTSTPTPTPTLTSTPTPTITPTPTPTPTLPPLNFTISSNCSNNGTIVISNFVGVASGQYRYSTGVYTTENDALNSTGYNFISSGSSGIVTIGSSGTYWVMVADWNNPSYKIAKSVTISCVTPTPTPTPTSTPTPTPTSTPIVTGYSFNLVDLPYNFPSTGNSIMNATTGQTGTTLINELSTTSRGFYFNKIDSGGVDRTSYYSQYTGQTVTITLTQNNSTAIYSGDTNSFKFWSQSGNEGFVFGTNIGVPPTGTPSGVATQIQSAPTPWVIGQPVYVSLSINPTPTVSSKSWSITQCGDPCDTGVCACNSQSTVTVYTLPSVTTLVVPGVTIYTNSSLTTTWNGYYYYPDSDEVWKFVNGVSSHQSSCAIGIDSCIV